MQYTVTVHKINVLGRIWMPNVVCAMSYTLNEYDLKDIREDDGEITREGVQSWLDTHAGDFSEITDFSANFGAGEFESPWQDEENEFTFIDCMFPEDD